MTPAGKKLSEQDQARMRRLQETVVQSLEEAARIIAGALDFSDEAAGLGFVKKGYHIKIEKTDEGGGLPPGAHARIRNRWQFFIVGPSGTCGIHDYDEEMCYPC